ncbi:hypothetical protein Tco_1282829 [Tanacetum coccineum]
MSKEVGTPRYLSLVVPLKKVGDEAVHKELGDRMERAATTASSLKAEQDSGSGPRCQHTILGDVNAQTRFEIKEIDVAVCFVAEYSKAVVCFMIKAVTKKIHGVNNRLLKVRVCGLKTSGNSKHGNLVLRCSCDIG